MRTAIGNGPPAAPTGPRFHWNPGYVATALLLIFGSCAALSIDVVRTGFGVKGDEATYVAMALSAAYDGDLAYESPDIRRFYRIYQSGPSGIFLKRGGGERDRRNRLYFGKAFIYSVLAAPFVRVAGLNGMLLFHVVLLSGTLLAAYVFLAARSPGGIALAYSLAFLGASIAPLYALFLSSDIFNLAGVSFAYFLWFYKEVAPPGHGRPAAWLRGRGSDIAAAVVLGLVTFSKPTHIFLIIPPLVLSLSRRRPLHASAIATVFAICVAAGFAINAGITGELNYQGGDRRTFYERYPFESPDAGFDNLGISMTTNEVVVEATSLREFSATLAANLRYFLVGRHFGFLPFFFPGLVTIALFLLADNGRRPWQWATLCVFVLTAVGLCAYMPYTWSGGGGPPGNRYFLSIYPVLLCLAPPLRSVAPAAVAWAGGTLFTAHVLINPFVAAKQPYLISERGLLRALPVELTMVDDLPVALDARRHRLNYNTDPALLLSLLDHNVHASATLDFWIVGRTRADIIVRSPTRLSSVTATLRSRVPNRVTIGLGGDEATVDLRPDVPTEVSLAPNGVYARRRWGYLLSVHPRAGFTPRLAVPGSRDNRFLGVLVRLTPHAETSDRAGSEAQAQPDTGLKAADGHAAPGLSVDRHGDGPTGHAREVADADLRESSRPGEHERDVDARVVANAVSGVLPGIDPQTDLAEGRTAHLYRRQVDDDSPSQTEVRRPGRELDVERVAQGQAPREMHVGRPLSLR